MDAYVFSTRVGPDDAYRFARGEPLALAPLDAQGRGTRQLRLARPLDFAAVTDHSEYFGGTRLCAEPDSPLRDSAVCQDYRSPFVSAASGGLAQAVREIFRRNDLLSSAELCGADGDPFVMEDNFPRMDEPATGDGWEAPQLGVFDPGNPSAGDKPRA